MRVFIVSGMEGGAGIVKWKQVSGGDPMFMEARKLYTEEINAAVRGAKTAGATEIVVMDCHGAGGDWTFNSLVPDMLDPDCEFVVQTQWTEYTKILEDGCDAALFIAMHAMAGTPNGVLSHTVSGTNWVNLRFNGTLVGETGINAALCGTWDCPVVLVTGDDVVCEEARQLLGERVKTVSVKTGLGRFSARQLAPQRARALIEDAAASALRDPSAVRPYKLASPCEIEVEFSHVDECEKYARKPAVRRTGPRSVTSTAEQWWAAWQQFYF